MTDADEFSVLVKPSAVRANEAVADLAADRGRELAYPDRTAAATAADRLSGGGDGRVRIQRVAPQDPEGVDAYLIADPERRTRDPEGSLESGLTYDVSGNQYGALGEALVLAHPVDPPGITRYVRRDLDLPEGKLADLRVTVEADPDPVAFVDGSGERLTWVPDCRATARLGPGGRVLGEYWCEIKTGDGSFERSQREVMGQMARTATVLAVRVDVGDLPDSYSVRIREESPRESGDGRLVEGSGRDATLDEFG